MIEPILLTATRIDTYAEQAALTNASGFFFERNSRLFLVTSRHVVFDEASGHAPDRLEIEFHTNKENLAESAMFSIPLYDRTQALWREAADHGGLVDVAVVEIECAALPKSAVYRAFTTEHLLAPDEGIDIGSSVLVVGFPLGFHDHLHHLPVVRRGALASSFGFRFQGQGYFLTDARTHRGISGAPVVAHVSDRNQSVGELPWRLLGIHSARLDIARDLELDEALGLNCAWYSDILYPLTEK